MVRGREERKQGEKKGCGERGEGGMVRGREER